MIKDMFLNLVILFMSKIFYLNILKNINLTYVINFAALAYATSWDKSFRYYDTNVTAVSKICEFSIK